MPDVTQELQEKLNLNYQQFNQQWLALSPRELVAQSDKIAATKFMYENVMEEVGPEEAAFLLRFLNPLEVLRDKWIEENGSEMVHDEELRHALWSIPEIDRGHELEPGAEPIIPAFS